jgi:hypothetical protein
MKNTILLCTITFLSFFACYSQPTNNKENKRKHEASFDLGACYSPVLSKDLFGFNLDMKYYPLKKIGTGLSISMTGKKISDDYSYSIAKPILYYYEFGWINQYDIIQRDKIRVGLNINNGISLSVLCDNSVKEKYWTKFGYTYKAKEVAKSYLGFFQPGLDVSFRLYSEKHYPDFYLTTKAKYRFAYGNTKFGELTDYSNYYFGLGISVIGFIEEETK